MIGSLTSGTNASLGAKNETKIVFPILLIELSPVDRCLSLRCLNDRIALYNMIELPACGTTNYLVAIIRTKNYHSNLKTHFDIQGILHERVLCK